MDKLQLSVRNVGLAGTDTSSGGAGSVRDTPAATHLAFSSDGATLVTVEAASLRASPLACSGASGEVLKFWERRPGAGYGSPYVLTASAEEPHRSAAGSGAVGGLAYHPSDDLVVSTSGAGECRARSRRAAACNIDLSPAWQMPA